MITARSFETVLILVGQMSSLEDETTMLSQNTGHQSHSGIYHKNVLLIHFLKAIQHEGENLSELLPDAYILSCCTYVQRNF